jgi:hypothetical protein
MGWEPPRGQRLREIEVVGVLPNPPAILVAWAVKASQTNTLTVQSGPGSSAAR